VQPHSGVAPVAGADAYGIEMAKKRIAERAALSPLGLNSFCRS